MGHTLSLGCPDAGDFLSWWHEQPSADNAPVHFIWQCTQAPAWDTLEAAIRRQLPPAQADSLCFQLRPQWWGLIPGWHWLPLHQEHKVLHLAIGSVQDVAQGCTGVLQQVLLHPGDWQTDPERLVAVISTLVRHDAQLHLSPDTDGDVLQHALQTKGWQRRSPTNYVYNPHWISKNSRSGFSNEDIGHAIIIGAGLSGAASAWSLARRGWQVTVLDRGETPAAGASGLPAGLVVPHTSVDDTRLSQITRAGIRCTLDRAALLLTHEQDWAQRGVLEHCVDGKSTLAQHWGDSGFEQATDWTQPASAQQLQAGLLPDDAMALWHPHAAWVKPPRLVEQLLAHPNIRFQGNASVHALVVTPAGGWQAQDADGKVLAQANVAVLAGGFGSAALLQSVAQDIGKLKMNALRGQAAWGWQDSTMQLPPMPVNGHGNMATGIPEDSGTFWLVGSTFNRGDQGTDVRDGDMAEIFDKLQVLHPAAAQVLAPQFASHQAQGWAGVRATLPDRLPAVGAWPLPEGSPPLLLCCGMGARGLSLAMLAGELLATQLHDEPWPTERKLGQMLLASRWRA